MYWTATVRFDLDSVAARRKVYCLPQPRLDTQVFASHQKISTPSTYSEYQF